MAFLRLGIIKRAYTHTKMPVITRSKYAATLASYPVTPPRIQRVLECPPAPVKLDLSKMRKRPISEGFVFSKSTEQKLAEALAEIEDLKTKLVKEKKQHTTDINVLENSWSQELQRVKTENAELLFMNDELKKRVDTLTGDVNDLRGDLNDMLDENIALENKVNNLKDRIQNPFKYARF